MQACFPEGKDSFCDKLIQSRFWTRFAPADVERLNEKQVMLTSRAPVSIDGEDTYAIEMQVTYSDFGD